MAVAGLLQGNNYADTSERASNEQDKNIFGFRNASTVWAVFRSDDESDYSGRNIELDS